MTKSTLLSFNRRGVLVGGASSVLLVGCSGLLGPTDAPQLYILKPVMDASNTGPKATWQLSVLMPNASENLDSDRIALVQNDATMDYYANAAWSDHLPRVVQTAIMAAFENTGRIDAVSRDSDGLRANYQLQTDLRDFEARYDQPDGLPTAVVRIEAKLIASPSRTIVAGTVAQKEVAAAQNSVPAVIQAFNTALGAVLSQIVDWTLSAPAPKPD